MRHPPGCAQNELSEQAGGAHALAPLTLCPSCFRSLLGQPRLGELAVVKIFCWQKITRDPSGKSQQEELAILARPVASRL